MTLYTINGVYPDKDFNFDVTAEDLQLVPEEHIHEMTEISGLTAAIAGKALSTHTHVGVSQISTGGGEFNDDIELISTAVTGHTDTCDFSVSGQTITINYISPEIGVAGTFMNANQRSDTYVLQLSTVDDAVIVSPAQGHLFCKERNVDIVTQNIEEFIKKINLVTAGQTPVTVKKVFLARKLATGMQIKEVWPVAAMRLRLESNYDNAAGQLRLANSQYSGPSLQRSALNSNPVRLTVIPYPEDAAWKIGHSDNISDSALFNTVYRGKQTVTVPFSLVNSTGEPEDTWLSAYPAADSGTAETVKFRFWCTQGVGDTPSNTGSDSSEPVIISDPPTHRWTFSGAAPLVDVVSGKSMETTKNPSAVSDHILSGGIGTDSLKNIVSVIAAHKIIVVNGVEYDASSSLDNPTATNAKYAWFNIDNESAIYTPTTSPAIGDAVYNADESDTGYTVEDTWTSNSNYFESNLDINEELEPVTVTLYVRQNMSWTLKIGNTLWLEGMYTNRINTRMTAYSNSQTSESGVTYPTKDQNTWYYMWTTFMSERMTPLSDDEAYTAERGYGFRVWKGFVAHSLGYPYARDPLKDITGYYAFSFTSGGISNNTTVPTLNSVEVPVVYALTENPAAQDDLYDAEGNKISKVNGWSAYKVEFQDDRWAETPYTQVWYNNKTATAQPFGSNNNTHTREIVWFNNGIYVNTKMCPAYNNGMAGTSMMTLDAGEAETNKINAFSDLRIYNRALTTEEISDLRNVLWGSVQETTTGVKFSPPGQISTNIGLNKIHVGDGWYIYNPALTVYNPSASDPYAARYGWELYSGTGTTPLWTSNYPPTNADFCSTTATGNPDTGKRVTQVLGMMIADYPLHCRLVPFIIDAKTIAVCMWTHDAVIRIMRTKHPYTESTMKFSEMGTWFTDSNAWLHGHERNLPIWNTHYAVQPEICSRADNADNWSVDGSTVSIRGRMYECPFSFEPTKDEMQWRNCQPGDDFYTEEPRRTPGTSWMCAPEIVQIAYLTLPTAMVVGSTHTVTWCDDSCTIEYGPDQYCATIKVNQEGYLPFSGIKRYAYLGRWLGTDTYMPDENDRTWYIVPSGSTSTSDAVYSGTMTQRCVANSNTGVCSDRYGIGDAGRDKPISGENTFEMDFSDFSTVSKAVIVAGGTTYFRDVVEDWIDGSVTISGGTADAWETATYDRSPADDTSNAYAWRRTPTGAEPAVIYTGRHTPDTTEQARTDYDPSDDTTYYVVSGSTEFRQYGWTTERTTEADYATATTVWTTDVSGSSVAMTSSGSTVSITGSSTAVTEDISGEYQIYIPNIGWSHKFLIHPDAITHQFWVNMRGLFHQRAGCDWVKHPYTNWEHPNAALKRIYEGNFIPFDDGQAKTASVVWQVDPITHDPMLDNYGARIALSNSGAATYMCQECNKYKTTLLHGVFGGWMDAADYDLRETHLPIIGFLAASYMLFPDNFTDNQLDLPESGDGIPDILSEALWGAQLYLKAQLPNGGIRAWFEHGGDMYSPHVPWESNAKYYACMASRRMSIQYAGPAARLAMALKLAASRATNAAAKAKMEALAKTYTESACAAWEYAVTEYSSPWMLKPESEREPVYFETQERTWAWREWLSVMSSDNDLDSAWKPLGLTMFTTTVSLYTLTRESRFKAWLSNKMLNKYISKIPELDLELAYQVCTEFISDLDSDFPDAASRIRLAYVSLADKWKGYQDKHAYRWHFWPPGSMNAQYGAWGATHPDKRGFIQIVAWIITQDEKYRNAILNAYDCACGCNPLGRSFTPWIGKVFPNRYLEHFTRWDVGATGHESAMPGVTPDLGCNYPNEWGALVPTVGMYFEGRDWVPAQSVNAFPTLCRQELNLSTSNWRDGFYYKYIPLFQGPCMFGMEDQRDWVEVFEFTVNETIASKAGIIGMLMIPGATKSRSHWKQVDRIMRNDNLGNVIALP